MFITKYIHPKYANNFYMTSGVTIYIYIYIYMNISEHISFDPHLQQESVSITTVDFRKTALALRSGYTVLVQLG